MKLLEQQRAPCACCTATHFDLPNGLIDSPTERHHERQAIITEACLGRGVIEDKIGLGLTAERIIQIPIGGAMGVEQHIRPSTHNTSDVKI